MLKWVQRLDQILRGEATRPEALANGSVDLPLERTAVVAVILAAFYGVCMGSFSLFKEIDPSVSQSPMLTRSLQFITTTIKVPALFGLTLLVTFPSLYVFNALVGSRLTLPSMARLIAAALAVNLCILASLGPIVAFFSVSTSSYRFIVLFNVLMFTMAGTLGLAFLLRTLNRLTLVLQRALPTPTQGTMPVSSEISHATMAPADDLPDTAAIDGVIVSAIGPPPADQYGALDALEGEAWGRRVRVVFAVWLGLFALVGGQMGWVLRPFVGNPNEPFALFRPRESNFFASVLITLAKLLGLAD